jgi:DNA-binding MarR family transcriptional regulator
MSTLKLLPQLIALSNAVNQLESKLYMQYSPAQTELLLLLQNNGPQTVSTLAQLRSVKLATMSQQILEMTNSKLVFLAKSKKDKRVKLVVLTEKGKQQLINIEHLISEQKSLLLKQFDTIKPIVIELSENLSNE